MPSFELTNVLHQWTELTMRRSMHEWMRFVKASGLSMPQFSVLMRLRYHGPCGVSDISHHLDVSNAAASQLVDRLVQHGLLERTEAAHDRRAKHLALTPRAVELVEQGATVRHQWMTDLPAHLTPEQQKAVTEALQYLLEAAQKS